MPPFGMIRESYSKHLSEKGKSTNYQCLMQELLFFIFPAINRCSGCSRRFPIRDSRCVCCVDFFKRFTRNPETSSESGTLDVN